MAEKYNKLFEEFPPVSSEDWKAKIVADLKGADFDRKLVWRTNEGFSVQPYYRQEDLATVDYLDTLPGEFPFVRGNKTNDNDWYVRQNIVVKDFAEANKKALDVLMKGVTSLGFVFNECNNVTKDDMAVLLKDICLESIEVNFVAKCYTAKIAEAFADYVLAGKWDPKEVVASVACDPFGNYLVYGRMKNGVDGSVEQVKHLIEKSAELPKYRVIAVNAKNFAAAGASAVQELAFALAQGAGYLTALTEAGLETKQVSKNVKFNFSVSANYFMEIAKFRAARMLWAQIVKAYGVSCNGCCKMNAYAETGTWNKTVYDPYVNMLRTQTEAMSAALGGVDSIAVLPFNAIYEDTTVFSDRIARNQQLLLKEESHFDKIVDPGAGSYYIEELTASIAEESWKLFLTVQEKGGFLAAAKEGFIQAEIKAMAQKREMNIATRRENVLGTNQFPNFTEKLEKDLDESVFGATDLTAEDAEIETLKPYRGAMAFEKLRVATDKFAKAGKRPLAFMLTIGNLAFRKARAQFACNFFAVAGYEVKDNNGFATVEEGVAAAKAAGAEIVVICSSDEEYADLAPAASDAMKGEGIFVVAGAPACMDDLKAKGIENFIHVKSNVLEDLKAYNAKLGIK
ncbi:methylmalonyl-CoA mutase small subunit [Mangrovibacterium diazotrophicum]|uniref:Methylmalonyl-CoA mutase small subunit n=1 Tax=Mangrovibacterium diazotrophicum TaxID=1261403 RepID=A0A419W922_9BACT|nr:methylmalonyl-CoA mutase small subunit [Mangrovibacterium diazotrophicum]RKD91892.1 heterodimeric methylmalonyl-CoA mutase small subunit [Mangrovibacterium diazotrophicum]